VSEKAPAGESSESVIARLRRNMGVLLTGGVATTGFGVLTLALNARALDPALLGSLALIQSYVIILGRVFSFDTWQGLIRFGAEAHERGDAIGVRAIVSFAMLFDAGSALAAGTAGLILLFGFGGLLHLAPEHYPAAAFYTAALFLQLPGAPIGLMRLLNKFNWQTSIAVAEGAAKLAAAAVLYAIHAPFVAYVYSYGAILIAGNLIRIGAALLLFRAETGSLRLASAQEMKLVARRFVAFSGGSWLTGTLNVTRRDGTTLVVGALLGPAGAGFYAVAQRIVAPIRDVADMLRQALFPDLSKLVARAEHAKVMAVLRRVLLYTIPVAVLTLGGILVLGHLGIRVIAGPGYERAFWPLVELGIACCLYICMPALSSLVILYAGMRAYTLGAFAAAAVWAATFTVPMWMWGIEGAGIGEVIFLSTWIAINVTLFRRAFRRKAAEAAAAAA
jgi:O-antigen/teichoic acid export membrane protein